MIILDEYRPFVILLTDHPVMTAFDKLQITLIPQILETTLYWCFDRVVVWESEGQIYEARLVKVLESEMTHIVAIHFDFPSQAISPCHAWYADVLCADVLCADVLCVEILFLLFIKFMNSHKSKKKRWYYEGVIDQLIIYWSYSLRYKS